MMKRFYKLLILFLLLSGTSLAQQQVMFTQYMFNGLALNPAYAGSHERISMSFLAREQWSGLNGAPSTQTFSIHSPVKSKKIGLGLLFLHDKIGVTSQTGVYGSYAYRIKFDVGTLSFGVQGGFSSYNADFSSVSDVNPVFANGDVNETQGNVGVGVYYSTKKYFIGASVPQLLESRFDRGNIDSDSRLLRHYFVTAGYLFELNSSLKLKPSMLLKAVSGAPVEVDINASLILKDVLWIGFSYRSFDSIDGLLRLQLTDKLQLGYSYDFLTTTELRRVNSGSHELMLNYRLNFNKTNIITPRYF